MKRYLMYGAVVAACLLLQMTLLPAYLTDPFQPNLLIVMVVYLGLNASNRFAPLAAFGLGILNDSFSGIFLGLHAFSFLCVYFLLAEVSDRLYTDNRFLLVLVVFLASIFSALLDLVMLMIFSVSQGAYASVLPALIPQALMNALAASLVALVPLPSAEEAR